MKRVPLHWQIMLGMLLGALIGISLNAYAGVSTTSVPSEELPAGFTSIEFKDSTDLIAIKLQPPEGDAKVIHIDGTRKAENSVATLKKLSETEPEIHSLFVKYGRSRSRWIGDCAMMWGGLFLRLLKMVAVPLIVTSLITGVMSVGNASQLGKMFGRTLLYYVSTSMLAIMTGLLAVNIIRPGVGSDNSMAAADTPAVTGDIYSILFTQLETMIPANPFAALAAGSFLSIISFSLAFSIFAVMIGGKVAQTIREFFEASFEVMMKMTMAIIKLAPLGVFFLMLNVTATQGPGVFLSLAWYMLAVTCALAFHALVTLPLIVKYIAKRNPFEFMNAMNPALLTAFSSASSNGTLPLTLSSVEQRAGISNKVSSFVLPLGATINMDGTALYEVVAVLFIAQFSGIDLSLSQQIIIAFTALLASIGAAGIPHAGLVMMVIILQTVGLPLESQGIILAVDRVLDMCRTMVNGWSDSCGCAVIARFEADSSKVAG
ncbi:MAG: proton glutamate symport protein [Pirellulaceae bacterium]|jgi:proton glutamate symport protein